VLGGPAGPALWAALPPSLRDEIGVAVAASSFDAVLTDCEGAALIDLQREISRKAGAIVGVHALSAVRFQRGENWPLDRLMNERVVTINTTAAGGNASLMAIG
jgi:RHH-type proline utilization regulon transcriptional repressor/proline dehydrogenase/delta 1-pyrroline-5-carboxylate dehydrogenase